MADTFPRQPRQGCGPNEARTVPHANGVGVECRDYHVDCTSTAWLEVARLGSAARARAMRDSLNSIFARPAADLEFIHPARMGNGDYSVVWSNVRWSPTHSWWTRVGQCSPTSPDYTTYEKIYDPDLQVIARVLPADLDRYGMRGHRVALLWANNVRGAVNGWNCTKDVVPAPVHGGAITPLPSATPWSYPAVTLPGTYYGYGECQPSFTMANGEIFHCMDLVLAVPGPHKDQARWQRNQWVRVSYRATGRSVLARLADVCGCDGIDLSRGVAQYLRFPGSGKVTISKP